MLEATHHILNNFLQGMVYFRYLVGKNDDADQEILELFDQNITDAASQVSNLDHIQNPTGEIIRERYLPN
jgi:hypothetical protein